ncbi:MAG TPA: hypothetical protein VFG36_06815 [Methanoregula sp.]|nr:hypothetical protein [Methanoregula sp.]
MDTRLSCLIWGIIGVVFGLLALLFPELLLVTFYGIFLLLAGLTMAIFLFLAITSRSEDSMFWFGLSAVLLVVIVLSFLVQIVVQIIFLLIIAGIAFYNGFNDITLALTHPKTKYFLIPGMFIAGAILLAGLLWYFPVLYDNLIIVILGNFAFVFGLVSILMGLYQKEPPKPDLHEGKWTSRDKACQIPEPGRKK